MNWHKSDNFAPLFLVFHGQQKYRQIRSLRQMAEVLIAAWPSFDGEEYLTAAKICLDAHLGTCSVNEARIALIRAAAEANIPVIAVVPAICDEQSSIVEGGASLVKGAHSA
jgi:hypothetical protein